MEFLQSLNVAGLNTIVFLQDKLPYSTYGYVNDILRWADTSSLYYGFVPLICACDLSFGISLLWTLVYSEWATQLFHWALVSDRPYWWMHESPYYLHKSLPYLRQYPLTCETGPATPSRVVSVNSAFYFLLTVIVTKRVLPRYSKFVRTNRRLVSRSIWAIYFLWIGLIIASQLYTAAYFPHQCLLGAVIGIPMAMWVRSKKSMVLPKGEALNVIFVMVALLGAVFGYARLFGGDHSVPIKKAIRWCLQRDFIQIEENPSYSVVRVLGVLLGLGVATFSKFQVIYSSARFTWKMRASLIILSITVGQSVLFTDRLLPTTTPWCYYLSLLILYLAFALTITSLLPKFVMKTSGVKPVKPKNREVIKKKKYLLFNFASAVLNEGLSSGAFTHRRSRRAPRAPNF